jgi:outer membrane lipoprotein-sorting protein
VAVIQAHYDSVRDFSADFEQTTRSALFGAAGADQAEPARGRVVFAKPGKMRWTYTTPEPSLVVSDGAILWLYASERKEAQRLPVTDGYLTGAALQFLLGDGKLVDSFDIRSDGCPFEQAAAAETEGSAPIVELELVPREPSSYERLGISANATTGEVVATSVVDLFGNQTRIAFQNIETNRDPAPDVFTFVPGTDVEVIELQVPSPPQP